MLGFIPIFILLGAAVAVVILQFVPKGTGIAWLVSIVCSIVAWIFVLFIKSRLPFSFSGQLLLDLGINYAIPSFQIDIITWPFVLSVCAIVIGAIITSSARIGLDANCREWSSILLLGVLGIFGCIASNILTVTVVLGLFDLVDIAIIFITGQSNGAFSENLKHVAWRLISLIIFMTAFAWENSLTGAGDDWKSLLPGPGYLILAGCMLRLAFLPSLKLTGLPRKSANGLFVSRVIIGFLISTAIIIQLPFQQGESLWKNVLLIYLLVVALIGTFWLIRNREREQPIAWQLFAGSLVCAEYLYGFSAAGIFFSISIIAIAELFILEYPISLFTKGVGVLAIIGFSGLPFTPNNTGLAGFNWNGQVPGFLFLLPAILVFFSFINNLKRKESMVNPMGERWASFLSPTGLIIPVITPWVISFNWLPNGMGLNISIQAIIMTIAGSALFLATILHLFPSLILPERIMSVVNQSIKPVKALLPKNENLPEEVIKQPYKFVTELFEGDGGILWAILCLVLVITILRSLGLS